MIVSWEEYVVPKKKNGNKINREDRVVKRSGAVIGSNGKSLAVACDDGVVRTVSLSDNRVLWAE